MPIDANKLVQKFEELKKLYVEVKAIMILAENIDKDKSVYIGSINELRNALDHIIRVFEYPNNDKLESEFAEATEHIYRAGYDAYENLAVNLGVKMAKDLEHFSPEIISLVFPQYYTEIKPAYTKLQIEFANARAHKKLNPETGTKSFLIYNSNITAFVDLCRTVEVSIPDLVKEKERLAVQSQRKKREKRIDRLVSFTIGVIVAFIAQVAFKYFYDTTIANSKSTTSVTNIDTGKNKFKPDNFKKDNNRRY